MDNFSRGLHSHGGTVAETSFSVCLAELKEQNCFDTICAFFGLVTKSYVVLF
jgi:hypothetical protein